MRVQTYFELSRSRVTTGRPLKGATKHEASRKKRAREYPLRQLTSLEKGGAIYESEISNTPPHAAEFRTPALLVQTA